MTTPEAQDHALHILLEERLGEHAPSDLTARILAAHQVRSNAPEPQPHQEKRRSRRRRPAPSPLPDRRSRRALATAGRWLLLPLLIALALVGCALAIGSTGAAPFIYTMF
ncbi:MAG: DUF5989 family protein [Planctomycetota bacterium]